MPQAIAYLGAYLLMSTEAVALGAFLLGNAAVIGTAALIVGGLAYSSYKARQAKDQATAQYNDAQVDRLATVSSTVAPRDLVLGRVRKAGTVFYKASTGANSQDLYLAIALAGHEVDAIEQIYLNDVPVTLDASGNVTTAPYTTTATLTASGTGSLTPPGRLPATYVAGTFTSGTYSSGGDADVTYQAWSYQYTVTTSYVQITSYLGAAGQTADAALQAAFPADWTAANTVAGVAYMVVKLSYSETAFPSGVPNVSAVVRGARVYDPRSATTAWSQNPALLMRHVYSHARFGKATVSAAEDTRFAAAANACDTATVYTVAGVAQASRALYSAALVAPFGAAPRSLLDDLAQAMGGSWAFGNGQLFLKPGTYAAPVMALYDADLAVIQRSGASETQRPISISVHKERAQKFNTVKAKIWDAAQDYKLTSLTPLVGSALLARDGAELAQEVSFAAIGYAPQALHVAGIMMRDARDPLVVELPFKLSAYPLELFDTVSLTLARYGWSAKTFMVLGRQWSADGSIVLTLKETTAAIVTMDAGFAAQGFADNTNLPNPWLVDPPSPISLASGTSELLRQQDGTVVSRLRISWPQVSNEAVRQAGRIEVQYKDITSSGAWASLLVPGDETQVITSEVADGQSYLVRARARTSLAVSDWGLQVLHTVVGKTEPPATVASLSLAGNVLTWPGVADIDLAGYRARFNYGANTDWSVSAALHDGLLTSSPYTLQTLPPGTVTIMLRAVDTSGNESLASAYVISNLGNTLVTNVVESTDYRATNWPGTIANATVVMGNLAATQSDPFYSTNPDSYFYQQDTAAFYSNNYDALNYISTALQPSLAAAGSNLTLDWTLAGDAPSVQFRRAGPAPFYDDALAFFFSADAAAFYSGPDAWATWPGSLRAENNQAYEFQLATQTGPTAGLLSALVASIDVPDKTLKLNNIALAAAGSRLSGAIGSFSVIENVQLTLQGGSTAVSLEITDKSATLGPLVIARNSAGTGVAAIIDALLQGY
jgi:hypothetical protein